MSLHIHDAVVWQETEHGISLYHTGTGDFRTLNPTAARIWALVSADEDRDTIARGLSLMYGGRSTVVTGRVRADVDRFLDAMIRDGLLAETGPDTP